MPPASARDNCRRPVSPASGASPAASPAANASPSASPAAATGASSAPAAAAAAPASAPAPAAARPASKGKPGGQLIVANWDEPISLDFDTPYQISKVVGEMYSVFYARHHDLPIVRARFQNVYTLRR